VYLSSGSCILDLHIDIDSGFFIRILLLELGQLLKEAIGFNDIFVCGESGGLAIDRAE
jgi:hypothetical protein